MKDQLFHWYSLTFIQSTGNGMRVSSVYRRCQSQYITRPMVDDASLAVNEMEGAALMSVSYLGHMTEDEFNHGSQP